MGDVGVWLRWVVGLPASDLPDTDAERVGKVLLRAEPAAILAALRRAFPMVESKTLLQYDTPQRIAAIARAGFKPTPAKRRLAGGTPAIHYALVNGAPAILVVVGDQVVGAVTFDIDNGKIATVRGIVAPTRLTRLIEAWRQHEPDTPLIAQW